MDRGVGAGGQQRLRLRVSNGIAPNGCSKRGSGSPTPPTCRKTRRVSRRDQRMDAAAAEQDRASIHTSPKLASRRDWKRAYRRLGSAAHRDFSQGQRVLNREIKPSIQRELIAQKET